MNSIIENYIKRDYFDANKEIIGVSKINLVNWVEQRVIKQVDEFCWGENQCNGFLSGMHCVIDNYWHHSECNK